MDILLLFDKEFEVEKEKLRHFLNFNSDYLNFSIGRAVGFKLEPIRHPETFDLICGQIQEEHKSQYRHIFSFTEIPYEDNFYFHEDKSLSIFSFYQWPYLTNLPVSNGILYFIIYYFALIIDATNFRHNSNIGCIYDFLWTKDGIDDGMRQAKICPNCLNRINKNLIGDNLKILDDLKNLMNLLSNSSKWNEDILKSYSHNEPTISKRKSKIADVIQVVIASPGDTHQERKILLEKLENNFRRGGHEAHCSKRLIVHAWEDLPSQNGYPQNVINKKIIEKVDIIISLFKHKLGTPTIDPISGMERAASGTVEELLYSLDTSIIKNPPLGMAYFYSKAPVVSLDSPNLSTITEDWKKLQEFKEKIRNKMIYKPFTEDSDLVQMISADIEKNVIENFF